MIGTTMAIGHGGCALGVGGVRYIWSLKRFSEKSAKFLWVGMCTRERKALRETWV
jgi:hypothetical protein